MSNNRHLLFLVMALCLTVIVGGGFLIIPAYHQANQNKSKTEKLRAKITGLANQTMTVTQLADAVSEMNERLDRELKVIPEVPDMASLMRKLSMPVDGVTIQDQTFTAGSPNPAIPGEEEGARSMPLTIDMVGRFDSVFALIRAAESMDRLLRVSSVRMEIDHDCENAEIRFVTASVGLDAIFEPVAEGEVH